MLKNIEIVTTSVIIGSIITTVYLKWLKPEKRFLSIVNSPRMCTGETIRSPNILDKFLIKKLEEFDRIINYAKLTKNFKHLPEIMTLPAFRQLQNRILSSGKEAVGVSSYKSVSFEIIPNHKNDNILKVLKIVKYGEKKMGGVPVPMGTPYKEIWELIETTTEKKLIIGGITLV